MNFHSWKACKNLDILTKVIKSNSDIFTDALYSKFNKFLEISVFPPSMKLANITTFHKEGKKDNYRLVSMLPNLSKGLKKCIDITNSSAF